MPANWKIKKWNAFFEYTNKHGEKEIGKGRKYVVDGVELELFPSSVLMGMLGRQLKTLYTWEKSYNFPQALWRVREEKNVLRCNRWYSFRQLVAIRTIYQHYNCLKKNDYKSLSLFIEAVRRVFYVVDIPVNHRIKNETSL